MLTCAETFPTEREARQLIARTGGLTRPGASEKNFGTGARQLLQATWKAVLGQNEDTGQIIARALMSRDPANVLAQAVETSASDATRRALVDALAAAIGQKVGYLMSQNP